VYLIHVSYCHLSMELKKVQITVVFSSSLCCIVIGVSVTYYKELLIILWRTIIGFTSIYFRDILSQGQCLLNLFVDKVVNL